MANNGNKNKFHVLIQILIHLSHRTEKNTFPTQDDPKDNLKFLYYSIHIQYSITLWLKRSHWKVRTNIINFLLCLAKTFWVSLSPSQTGNCWRSLPCFYNQILHGRRAFLDPMPVLGLLFQLVFLSFHHSLASPSHLTPSFVSLLKAKISKKVKFFCLATQSSMGKSILRIAGRGTTPFWVISDVLYAEEHPRTLNIFCGGATKLRQFGANSWAFRSPSGF